MRLKNNIRHFFSTFELQEVVKVEQHNKMKKHFKHIKAITITVQSRKKYY